MEAERGGPRCAMLMLSIGTVGDYLELEDGVDLDGYIQRPLRSNDFIETVMKYSLSASTRPRADNIHLK
jgi:hypothetical protein